LLRDNRLDLIRRIDEKRISYFAAAVLAGYAKRPRLYWPKLRETPRLDVKALIA